MSVFAVANRPCSFLPFFFNDTATTEIYTLSLHDALPICAPAIGTAASASVTANRNRERIIDLLLVGGGVDRLWGSGPDRKSTRLNSSHSQISYAVFCLKKKNHLHSNVHNRLLVAPAAGDN